LISLEFFLTPSLTYQNFITRPLLAASLSKSRGKRSHIISQERSLKTEYYSDIVGIYATPRVYNLIRV